MRRIAGLRFIRAANSAVLVLGALAFPPIAGLAIADPAQKAAPPNDAAARRNPATKKLCSQYLDLASREADWARRFGEQHLAVINLRSQMQDICRSIDEQLHSNMRASRDQSCSAQSLCSEIVK